MKRNKLKALLIAACCLVAALWSETQGMQKITYEDTPAVRPLEPFHPDHASSMKAITVDFSAPNNNNLTNDEKSQIRKLITNNTTCSFTNYNSNDKITKQVNKFSSILSRESPDLKIFK
jgi:hypothetical protein